MTSVVQVEYRYSLLELREEILQSLGHPVISAKGTCAARSLDLSGVSPGVIVIGHRASRKERQELIAYFRKTVPHVPIVALLGRLDADFEEVDFNCPADNPPLWVRIVTEALAGIQ
jgi:DNA-binding NtrC family response regulator